MFTALNINFKQQTFMDKRQLRTGIYNKFAKWM